MNSDPDIPTGKTRSNLEMTSAITKHISFSASGRPIHAYCPGTEPKTELVMLLDETVGKSNSNNACTEEEHSSLQTSGRVHTMFASLEVAVIPADAGR